MDINYEIGTIGFLDITFGPNWDYIPLTRNYIENFLLVRLDNKKNVSKISMSASELLENAVRYSSSDGIRLIMRKYDDKPFVELIVSNFVEIENGRFTVNYINDMKNHDPIEFYIEKMKQSVKSKETHPGLGLARIRAEGNADITVTFNEDIKVLEVEALFEYQ